MAVSILRSQTIICKNCGESFLPKALTGARPKHCGKICRTAFQIKNRKPNVRVCSTPDCGRVTRTLHDTKCNRCGTLERNRAANKCQIQKCNQPSARAGAALCEKHYYRVRRTGNTDDPAPAKPEIQHSGGYKMLKQPQHPLAMSKSGWVFEHRVIAYDTHQGVVPDCHWCGKKLTWPLAVVDHLNGTKIDNEPANLVVSCHKCNAVRGLITATTKKIMPKRVEQYLSTLWPTLTTG